MNKYMKLAIDQARQGITKKHGGPFGTVIVKDGKVIAKGHNHVLAHNDPTCHGEVDAIRKAGKKLNTFDLSGCELYTTGEPCPMCLCACLWANIEKVYYGCTIKDNEMIGFRDDKGELLGTEVVLHPLGNGLARPVFNAHTTGHVLDEVLLDVEI